MKAGNNILLDGEGDDALYGGDGDDILISTGGNVTLAAGKGNNIIFINRLNGHVKIINNGGKDSLILQDKNIYNYQVIYQNSDILFRSANNLSSLLIENYDERNVIVKAGIGHAETFDNQQLDGLIDFMAAFEHKEENSSIDLMTYLSTFNVNADFNVATRI